MKLPETGRMGLTPSDLLKSDRFEETESFGRDLCGVSGLREAEGSSAKGKGVF